jgi:NADH-quinone oxidoreductase subunit N
MATGVSGRFAALARVLAVVFGAHQEVWGPALAGIAVVSMIVGNLVALNQRSIKRLLAYSSVAHAGYLLAALVPGTGAGGGRDAHHLFAYVLTSLAAFGLLTVLGRDGGGCQPRFDRGLEPTPALDGRRARGLHAVAAGFPRDLRVHRKVADPERAALERSQRGCGRDRAHDVVSAGYYLPIIMASYMRTAAADARSFLRCPASWPVPSRWRWSWC